MNDVIDTPNQIALFGMATQISALKLEVKGMKHSRGSVYALVKRVYGLKGSKQRVLEQLQKLYEERKQEVLGEQSN